MKECIILGRVKNAYVIAIGSKKVVEVERVRAAAEARGLMKFVEVCTTWLAMNK